MGRSGYNEDGDTDSNAYLLWPTIVRRSIEGKRGQAFIRELVATLDAMPDKRLIEEDLVTSDGECCAMGAVCKARGLDVRGVDPNDRDQVGKLLNIAPTMAAEIAFQNDDEFRSERRSRGEDETPEERWTRMRAWAQSQLKAAKA